MTTTAVRDPNVKSSRVGSVRPSQLMYAFGVGSLVDLPNFSVIIAGLDDWSRGHNELHQAIIAEPRLLDAVRHDLGRQVGELRTAPWLPETRDAFDEWTRTGVSVVPFPRWMRCTRCHTLGRIDGREFNLEHTNPWRPDLARYVHSLCTYGKPAAVPARMVIACANAHMDDFPWIEFAHKGAPCATPRLRARDVGSGSRSTDMIVACTNCAASTGVAAAFGEHAGKLLPACRGRHAHLRHFESGCGLQAKPLLLGASNAWFPVTRSVLSIPSGADDLGDAIARLWNLLEAIPGAELPMAIKYDQKLVELRDFDPDEVQAAIDARRGDAADADQPAPNLLAPEWEVFAAPAAAPSNRDFRLRAVAAPVGHDTAVAETVLVERVREVVALTGFTRIDGPDSGVAEDLGPVKVAPLVRAAGGPEWVPAAEVRGEGVFLRLPEQLVDGWCDRAAGTDRTEALRAAHERWRSRRGMPHTEWPGERYLLLHSLAHALINEAALECGYAAASIRERIYAGEGGDGNPPMAGILLYTSASDSEGTLGGLVALGEPATLGRLIDQAMERARLCSSDPMCAEHQPAGTGDALHNAACHACLFLPETSCERGNRFLDRNVLVDTLAGDDLGYLTQVR